MTWVRRVRSMACAILVGAGLAVPALAQEAAAFRCGGDVESQAWKVWDTAGRAVVAKTLLDDRLIGQGDTYGLYDVQGSTHNLLAMAIRCGRTERLLEMARLVSRTYEALVVVPGGGLGWVCKGGRVCKEGSSLHGTEVPLNSAQFMGLASRVASGLADLRVPSPEAREFVAKTALVTVHHLNRWSQDRAMLRLDERMGASPRHASDGQSKWFFTDVDLWIIAMYAELAGVLEARPDLRDALVAELAPQARERLEGLLRLLKTRLTLAPEASARLKGGRATVGDLDRGFWRHYRDNRYAGYAGSEPPVSCSPDRKGANVRLKPEAVPVVESGGWDLSHARRLVHVIDAIDRQRGAMLKHFKLGGDALPTGLGPAFAATLVARVWNGDRQKPLFANYWDGTNGWYRASHISAGNCFEGYEPSGLSDAFALGGFAMWSSHQPELGELARRLYALAASNVLADQAFMRRYYAGLGPGASTTVRTLAQLQFWPSLVGTQP